MMNSLFEKSVVLIALVLHDVYEHLPQCYHYCDERIISHNHDFILLKVSLPR